MKLDASRLTFIAESLGRRETPPLGYLSVLARHADPVVREGAVYGIAPHVGDPRAVAILRGMLDDRSQGVRTSAMDALE